jgi:hypothetical protein
MILVLMTTICSKKYKNVSKLLVAGKKKEDLIWNLLVLVI